MCSSNRSTAVLKLFKDGVDEFELPYWVRGDKGDKLSSYNQWLLRSK
jgi:hypothetical protein